MASRWQSSAGSDARSATASDWSISVRFVADSLESFVGNGQASSQVVRGSFSCSTSARCAGHFLECSFFTGFTDISSGLKIPGPFMDVRVRVPPPLLTRCVASSRTSSLKSAMCRDLGVFFCVRPSLSLAHPLAADRGVSRAVCCAWRCALCGASTAWRVVPIA